MNSQHRVANKKRTNKQSVPRRAGSSLTCFQLSKTTILLSSSSTVTAHSYPSPAETNASAVVKTRLQKRAVKSNMKGEFANQQNGTTVYGLNFKSHL